MTDLRVRKTKEAIYETIKVMIMEKDANKITVKELTQRANIHYKTFYLHYTCIEALFEDLIGQMLEGYYREIEKIPADAPFVEVNRVFFEYMSTLEPYMEKIMTSPSYNEFAEKGFLLSRQHNRSRYNPYAEFSIPEQNIINTYLCVTSVNIYRQWIKDGKVIPVDKLIDFSGTLLCDGINTLLAQKKA